MNENYLLRNRLRLFENLILWQHKLLSFIYSIIMGLFNAGFPPALATLLEEFVYWPSQFLKETKDVVESVDSHVVKVVNEVVNLVNTNPGPSLSTYEFDKDKVFQTRMENIQKHIERNFDLHVKQLPNAPTVGYELPPGLVTDLQVVFKHHNQDKLFAFFLKSAEFTQLIVSLIAKVFVKTPQLFNDTPLEFKAASLGLVASLENFWAEQVNASIGQTGEFEFSFKSERFKDFQNYISAAAQQTTNLGTRINLAQLNKDTVLALAAHEITATKSQFLSPINRRLNNAWDEILSQNFTETEAAYLPKHVYNIFTNVSSELYNRSTYAKIIPFSKEIDYARCVSYNFFEQICLYKLLLNYLVLALKSNQVKKNSTSLSPHLFKLIELIKDKIF